MADAITLDIDDAKMLRAALGRLPGIYRGDKEHRRVMMLYARLDRVITGKRRGLRTAPVPTL